MVINSVNLFNNIPYVRKYNKTSFSLNNLSPLKQDTVSFSGVAKLEGECMEFAPSHKKCETMYYNAKPAELYLQKVLENYLAPLNKHQEQDKKLITITTRTKSDKSIREKAAAKFYKITHKEKDDFCEEAIPLIFKYYIPAKGFTQEQAKIQAKILLNCMNEYKNVPPYKNEKCFLTEIINYLEISNLIKINSPFENNKDNVNNTIEKQLKKITNNEHCDKNGAYIDPSTNEGIKHYVNDIVGARIILNDSNSETVQKVLKSLKNASINNKINIISVENFVPNMQKLKPADKITDYEYLPERQLKHFAVDTDSEYKKIKSKSGYIAIHINIDLSNKLLETKNNKFNGYKGEIQILDSNIENLKDVEDLCYKLKDNKNSLNPQYNAFKKHFLKYYKNSGIKETFDEYTYALYMDQRKKFLNNIKNNKYFTSLNAMGYGEQLPFELDFNVLKSIKTFCENKSDNKLTPELIQSNIEASGMNHSFNFFRD